MVRQIRRARRVAVHGKPGSQGEASSPELVDDLTRRDEGEDRQIPFDGAPQPLVDKSGVPDDPAQCVTVVAGLPRSGTSMMMQMLAAGGLELLSDGKRVADADNPKGYHELERATRLRQDKDWVADAEGKAVKVVAQLLPALPKELPYRVLLMERDLDEVVKSQSVMLERLGRSRAKLSDDQLEAAYRQQLQRVRIWLARQPNVRTLFVSHRQAIEEPSAVASQVNAFLGDTLDPIAMAAVVDGSLYRQRAEA